VEDGFSWYASSSFLRISEGPHLLKKIVVYSGSFL
jgi:hypothetical protein